MSDNKGPEVVSQGAAVIIAVMAFIVVMLGLSALGLMLLQAIAGMLS